MSNFNQEQRFNGSSPHSSEAPVYNNEESEASKWLTWAKEEEERFQTKVVRPFIPTTEHSSHNSSNVLQHDPPLEFFFQSCDDFFKQMTSEQPLCFCKKPAHRTFEHGAILQCAKVSEQRVHFAKDDYPCVFHVHETSWSKIRENFTEGRMVDIEYSELKSCPSYNITYCAVFDLLKNRDDFPPLGLPSCICGQPVILWTTIGIDHQPRYFFICEEQVINRGWNLEVDPDRGFEEQDKERQLPPESHLQNLLAALCGYNSREDHVAEGESKEGRPTGPSHLMIPTSVLGRMQSQTSNSAPLISDKEREMERLKLQNALLTLTIQREEKEAQQRIQYSKNEMVQVLDRLKQAEQTREEKLSSTDMSLKAEIISRQNYQNMLAHSEIKLVKLFMEKGELKDNYLSYREKVKRKYLQDKELVNKCKVCYQRDKEFVTLPCHHYGR